MKVLVGQKWKSLRNSKVVEVLEVRTFDGGIRGARVMTRPGYQKWITVSQKGIIGYRIVDAVGE